MDKVQSNSVFLFFKALKLHKLGACHCVMNYSLFTSLVYHLDMRKSLGVSLQWDTRTSRNDNDNFIGLVEMLMTTSKD